MIPAIRPQFSGLQIREVNKNRVELRIIPNNPLKGITDQTVHFTYNKNDGTGERTYNASLAENSATWLEALSAEFNQRIGLCAGRMERVLQKPGKPVETIDSIVEQTSQGLSDWSAAWTESDLDLRGICAAVLKFNGHAPEPVRAKNGVLKAFLEKGSSTQYDVKAKPHFFDDGRVLNDAYVNISITRRDS